MSSQQELSRQKLVRRVWAILNGVDPDQLEADIDSRTAELKAEMQRAITG